MITKRQIALIHVAKTRIGMTEDEYRAMLSGFGVESSTQLTQGKFERVVEYLEKLGFTVQRPRFRGKTGKRANGSAGQLLSSRDRLRGKVRAILRDLRLTDAYADAIARNRFGVDAWWWLTADELYKLTAMLTYHQRRKMETRSE
jgi:phage gp16-like protein